jgi:hypothetical protein
VLWWLDAKVTADFADKVVADLGVAWYSGAAIQRTIDEPGM